MKEIKIAYKEKMVLLTLDEMHEFQNDLKSLDKEDYKRFKKEIIDTDLGFAPKVWFDPKKKKYFICGGHQTKRVITQMKIEGYIFPEKIPCFETEAKTFKEAKRRVLQDASSYGKVEEQQLYEFMHENEFTIDDVKDSFQLRDVDMPNFDANFFKNEPPKNEEYKTCKECGKKTKLNGQEEKETSEGISKEAKTAR